MDSTSYNRVGLQQIKMGRTQRREAKAKAVHRVNTVKLKVFRNTAFLTELYEVSEAKQRN